VVEVVVVVVIVVVGGGEGGGGVTLCTHGFSSGGHPKEKRKC